MAHLALGLAVIALTGPSGTGTGGWDLKTPGGAAYCRTEFPGGRFDSFRCIRPSDGFWIRFTGLVRGENVRVTTGRADRYRTVHGTAAYFMGFGRSWLASDAAIVSCVSRRAGLTCKHYDGLSFWLGRSRGYRIYYDAPGFPPDVHPLFRTDSVWCGIDQAVLEDSNPILECWRPADGLELSVTHVEVRHRGRQGRREKAIGFRPSGFQRLRLGRSFVWRCTKIDSFSATHCSANSGQRVFTCHNGRAGLACRNRHGRGFWVNARAFDTF